MSNRVEVLAACLPLQASRVGGRYWPHVLAPAALRLQPPPPALLPFPSFYRPTA
jgi:hypothetical protein